MKTASILLTSCLLAVMTLPVSAHKVAPNNDFVFSAKVTGAKTIEVSLLNLQQERTVITLQSLDGATTYFEEVVKKHNGYRRQLNLRELSAGKYLLVVKRNEQKLQQVVVVSDQRGVMLSDVK